MIKQTATLIALISAGSILTSAYGCSSSTTATSTDAGTGTDTGATTMPVVDSSTPTTDSGGNTGHDSGSTGSNDAGGGSEDAEADAGPTCPGNVSASDIPTYAATTQTPGACADSDIVAFVAACYSSTATSSGCQTFLKTFNTTCLSCIAPQNSTSFVTGGPQLVNPTTKDPLLNTPGCIAIEDTSQTTCASDFANFEQCVDVACSSCSDVTTGGPLSTACYNANGGDPCATYTTAITTDCPASDEADGGILSQCQDPTFVLTLYCGGGDGGAGDGG